MTERELIAGLLEPTAYASRPASVEVRETHISCVLLARDRAFKFKKPLRLPFVDYGTLDRRHAFCREEVRLNSRLAPDVYRGVRAVVPSADGVGLAAEENPQRSSTPSDAPLRRRATLVAGWRPARRASPRSGASPAGWRASTPTSRSHRSPSARCRRSRRCSTRTSPRSVSLPSILGAR